ncbi:MAG: hypothetical protein JSW61_00165 [Candidatus Thorarchaeota archaeon]|nr:MAG: hypothetical protein JSW61_00165 [Candidatus Thorarchaeota archaeon]
MHYKGFAEGSAGSHMVIAEKPLEAALHTYDEQKSIMELDGIGFDMSRH